MNFKKGEVLFFNKPFGWTSFKVVGHARYHICRRIGVKKLKVGHAGTLDPLATGVMIVCTGKATKRIEEFQYHTKEYVATLRLGATTPSYDLEHEIDATYPTEHITRELVEEVLTHFIGAIDQVRVVVVPEMMKWAGAGADASADVISYKTGGKFDVFPMLIVGDQSFTTIGFQTDGKSVKFVITHKKPGTETADRNDPYGETGFMSIKWYYGFMVLRPERIGLIKTVARL